MRMEEEEEEEMMGMKAKRWIKERIRKGETGERGMWSEGSV